MHTQQPRIVVADNDPAGRATLKRQLLAAGCEVNFASSGSDIIWHFYTAPPDVLILDVDLPDMDGFDVCEYVRHHLGGSEATVIFVSAPADEMTRVNLGQMVEYAGGDYFFAKPYDARLLVKVVDEMLCEGLYATDRPRRGFPTRVVWPTSRCSVSAC